MLRDSEGFRDHGLGPLAFLNRVGRFVLEGCRATGKSRGCRAQTLTTAPLQDICQEETELT